jgi:hypothetical protein
MSRPIRRDETPATEVGSRVPVSLKKSPVAELAGRMLLRFGSSVRDRPPLLPLVAKELPSALFSAAEAQVDRIAKRLLGEAVEPEATALPNIYKVIQ